MTDEQSDLTVFEEDSVEIEKADEPKIEEKGTLLVAEDEEDAATNIFEQFMEQESLFTDKKVLQLKYLPENIPHRIEQIKQLALVLAPTLRGEKPSNLFLFGKTGTGKTLCISHTLSRLKEAAKKQNKTLKTAYLNCKLRKVSDTEYRVIAYLTRELGKEVPITGLPTEAVYNLFVKELDKEPQVVILVLDEIDQLIKKTGDEFLYNLTRINAELKKSDVCVVGISNDVRFMENVDPRVKSSLGEEELIFPPYNALELKDILEKRAQLAFREGIIDQGVLAKCAAYAAREHGDARRALDLLRVAAEMAEREGAKKIEPNHIDLAEDKIEKSRILEIIETQPKQSQVVLYALLLTLEATKNDILETGEVFHKYVDICKETQNHILTQRRISDLISELDMLGLITAKLISKGRYGRTREIYCTIPQDMIDKIKETLKRDLYL